MVVYSRNDPLMCLTFLSCLKGVFSDWFYSLPPRSLYNFDEITKVFPNQYASCWEAKKNNDHLPTVKIRQGDNFKLYIGYFQNQLSKVRNCVKDALVYQQTADFSSSMQAPTEARCHSDERGSVMSSALHSIGGNKELRQPGSKT